MIILNKNFNEGARDAWATDCYCVIYILALTHSDARLNHILRRALAPDLPSWWV